MEEEAATHSGREPADREDPRLLRTRKTRWPWIILSFCGARSLFASGLYLAEMFEDPRPGVYICTTIS